MSATESKPIFQINSTFKLNSKDSKGSHYEMPLLGFGVSQALWSDQAAQAFNVSVPKRLFSRCIKRELAPI